MDTVSHFSTQQAIFTKIFHISTYPPTHLLAAVHPSIHPSIHPSTYIFIRISWQWPVEARK